MIAIVDYGVGNIFSLTGSLNKIGVDNKITADIDEITHADKIILPGVGAFGDAIKRLNQSGLTEVLKKLARQGKPLLGICLGMQMLFDKSFEYGENDGLGLLSGQVCPLEADLGSSLKVPHIGWNSLDFVGDRRMASVSQGDFVYFVHSFYAKNCQKDTIATSEYGVAIPAIVGKGNVLGMQFHPEKSGEVGLKLLKEFAEKLQ